jgi:hypothetical protein
MVLLLAAPAYLLVAPAFARTPPAVNEPVCEPTGRTSKGDLVIQWNAATFRDCPLAPSQPDII